MLRQGADMAEVHQLIIQHGIEEARRQAVTKHERMVIEAAFQVLSEDAEKMGFTYSGFALTSLPHKPQTDLTWKRDGHNLTMLIQSGVDRSGKPLGLPYGSYARFILLFLQSEAIRTGSREIELGRSMRVWLGCMGLSIGGMTYKKVNEQARRISGCSLTFFADRAGAQIKSRGGFREDRDHDDRCGRGPANALAGQGVAGRGFLPRLERTSRSTERNRAAGHWRKIPGHRYLHLARI